MNYDELLQSKIKTVLKSGFKPHHLNSNLFPFQSFIVDKALQAGKYALFEDCGLGKTIQQLEWAWQVSLRTGKPVLILCPLAVAGQTIKEGAKFSIPVIRYDGSKSPIQITNYEQLENIDVSI